VVIVIGGGASGLVAAIAAGRILGGGNVKIVEKNDRVGRKLLATGNGRCNLTNMNVNADSYIGEHPEFCARALRRFTPEAVIGFFEHIGLLVKMEDGGRVYPKCSLASAVLDTLRNEISRLSIEIIQADVTDLSYENSSFSLYSSNKKVAAGERVIVTTGGQAAPFTGSDGGGYHLLSQFGHRINTAYPALVQLRSGSSDCKALNGIRVYAGISLMENNRLIACQEGELQFTNYGVSGIPALNLSGMAGQGNSLLIDFSPDTDNGALLRLLKKRAENLSSFLAEQYFTGFFHKKIGGILLKYVDRPAAVPISQFSETELKRLVKAIKTFPLPLRGTLGFTEAQVTGGGIQTRGFNPGTMESLKQPGLYAAGEVLDIYGPCGGYNLQWAWASGYLAGESAGGNGAEKKSS